MVANQKNVTKARTAEVRVEVGGRREFQRLWEKMMFSFPARGNNMSCRWIIFLAVKLI